MGVFDTDRAIVKALETCPNLNVDSIWKYARTADLKNALLDSVLRGKGILQILDINAASFLGEPAMAYKLVQVRTVEQLRLKYKNEAPEELDFTGVLLRSTSAAHILVATEGDPCRVGMTIRRFLTSNTRLKKSRILIKVPRRSNVITMYDDIATRNSLLQMHVSPRALQILGAHLPWELCMEVASAMCDGHVSAIDFDKASHGLIEALDRDEEYRRTSGRKLHLITPKPVNCFCLTSMSDVSSCSFSHSLV